MNNTLRIRSLLKDISVPHHFIFKKGAYFRVIEDVAQGSFDEETKEGMHAL